MGVSLPVVGRREQEGATAADYRCETCRRSEAEKGCALEIDHQRSVNRGEVTTLTNGQARCRECNRKKQAELGDELTLPASIVQMAKVELSSVRD
jgi:hypothetical protein